MQIRRSSKLNAENVLAVGYPVGLIVDGEKGSTVAYAKDGAFHLKNVIFAGMGVIGTDKNKEYEDYLYDYATKTEDRTKPSFSHTFFLSEPTNKVTDEAALGLTDPKGTGQNYCPPRCSPTATEATSAPSAMQATTGSTAGRTSTRGTRCTKKLVPFAKNGCHSQETGGQAHRNSMLKFLDR